VRVAALADLHGRLQGVVVPPCDLVVIAGDLSPYSWKQAPNQVPWLEAVFAPWLERIAAEAGAPVVGIAGNRDFAWWWDRRVFEKLPWTYLRDAEATLAGARVYGSPWCPRRRARPKADEPQPPSPPLPPGAKVPHWPPRGRGGVFMAGGEDELAEHFGAIPDGIDVLLTHTPPRGHGDLTSTNEHVGSTALLAAIELRRPALSVFGHIHEGRVEPTRAGRTLCANSAICDRWFERRHQPWLIDVDLAAGSAELVGEQNVKS
jgi:predicted phosphodiesterase